MPSRKTLITIRNTGQTQRTPKGGHRLLQASCQSSSLPASQVTIHTVHEKPIDGLKCYVFFSSSVTTKPKTGQFRSTTTTTKKQQKFQIINRAVNFIDDAGYQLQSTKGDNYNHVSAESDSVYRALRNPARPTTPLVVRHEAGEARRSLELSVEPSVPPVNTVPHDGQMEPCEERGGA